MCLSSILCDLRRDAFTEDKPALQAPLKLFTENFLNFGNKFNFMFSDYIFDKASPFTLSKTGRERKVEEKVENVKCRREFRKI